MDDLGINKWLDDSFGRTPENYPYFRLIWSTGITEKRYSEFHDFSGDILIRVVRETREVLKYPFAQDRWIIERIKPVDKQALDAGGLRTDDKFTYEEVYIFQDKEGNFLPLSPEMAEAAIYLYFRFFLTTKKQRYDHRMELLARKSLEAKQKTKEALGEGRSPFGFVLE